MGQFLSSLSKYFMSLTALSFLVLHINLFHELVGDLGMRNFKFIQKANRNQWKGSLWLKSDNVG